MTTDVLGSQLSATECELGCAPLPANAIDTVPALLPIAMDPATLPVADGVNTTLSATVCPGANVVLAPLTANPAPFTSTLEIVTFAFPVLVSVAPSELLVPSNTLPKSRPFVLELNSGVDATELALVEIVRGEFGALLTREIEPVTFPAELGIKTTLNAMLWPGAMLIGNAKPEVLKPVPVTPALDIVTLAVPPFCNVMVCELVDPVATAGKLALMGIAESCGWGCGLAGNDVPDADAPLFPEGLDPITTPAQPLPTIEAAITIAFKHLEILFVSDLVSAIVGQV
jgi:hypothetical protein